MSAKPPPSQPIVERRRWARQQRPTIGSNQASQQALKPLTFSTADREPKDQFEAWATFIAPVMDVRLPDDVVAEDGFTAYHVAWNLGGMILAQQRVSAHRYQRSEAKLRSSLLDHWSVQFRRSGKSWTEVGGVVAESSESCVEIRSLGHPFRGRMLASEYTTLYLPRDLFADSVAILDANNNIVLSSNLAGVISNYVASIEARLLEFTQEDLPGVVKSTRDLLIACVSSSESRAPVTTQEMRVTSIERARRFIRNNLNRGSLTPDMLAKELGISRTSLYQLFEQSGGVAHYIQRQRLLAGHAALSDPRDRRQISVIADALGFNSSADFSRAFSREFGYSPRAARNLVAPVRGGRQEADAAPVETGSFESWLKGLGS